MQFGPQNWLKNRTHGNFIGLNLQNMDMCNQNTVLQSSSHFQIIAKFSFVPRSFPPFAWKSLYVLTIPNNDWNPVRAETHGFDDFNEHAHVYSMYGIFTNICPKNPVCR